MGVREIRGFIRLPSPQQFNGAIAVVGLDDVSMIDAPAVRVAAATIGAIRGTCDRIAFRFTVEERRLTARSYVLAAEVRRSPAGRLSPGDFLTTAAFPWTPDDRGEQVLDVVQID